MLVIFRVEEIVLVAHFKDEQLRFNMFQSGSTSFERLGRVMDSMTWKRL